MLEGSVLYTFLSQSIIVITTLAFSVKQASLEQCSLVWRSRILLLSRWAWLYILHLSKLTFPHLSNRKNIMCITLEIVFEIKWDDYLKGLVYCLCVCVCVCSIAQLCLTVTCGLWLPGSSAHGILQARILTWIAMPLFRGSSQPRYQTQVSCLSCTAPPGSPSILPGM